MVGEVPEVQGVVGGYLAEAQGEPKAIAHAIRDHYKPVGQGDEAPMADGGRVSRRPSVTVSRCLNRGDRDRGHRPQAD